MLTATEDARADRCPHCGQPLPITVAEILAALKEAERMIVAESRVEQARLAAIRRVLDNYGGRLLGW